jgi:hypothetical protein
MLTPAFMPPPMPICMMVWLRLMKPTLSMYDSTYLHHTHNTAMVNTCSPSALNMRQMPGALHHCSPFVQYAAAFPFIWPAGEVSRNITVMLHTMQAGSCTLLRGSPGCAAAGVPVVPQCGKAGQHIVSWQPHSLLQPLQHSIAACSQHTTPR